MDKKDAFSKISGYVWIGPQALFLQLKNVSKIDFVCVSSAYENVKTKKVVRFFGIQIDWSNLSNTIGAMNFQWWNLCLAYPLQHPQQRPRPTL